jgi:UDP-GlcNAc:undecaprenyl-phosphate/decaprenyl-phosphate GlcNAc-1-phosphate transferase
MKKLIDVVNTNSGIHIIFYVAISFLISFLVFPVLIKILKQWKLFDESGAHKIHSVFTPSMGGVSIILGVTITLLIVIPFQELSRLKYFFIGLSLMFIIGLRDDILALNPKQKLYSQFLPVLILVLFDGTVLNSTYGIMPVSEFSTPMAWAVSTFTIVIITNAYNLIDGVDGLAGALGIIILLCFGSWFYVTGEESLSLVAFCFIGSLGAFLFFNWQPSKIFMGDTGALMVGLLLSYLAIKFINMNFSLPDQGDFKFKGSIATAVCVLIIPIFDTLRVIILRIRKMQSPFQADRNHLHHQFLNLGFSHSKTVLFIVGINVFFIFLAWILKEQTDLLILPLILVFCLIINFTLRKLQERSPKSYGGKG